VHEGGYRIEMLDDGALRFLKPNGSPVDSIAPGYTQQPGDWRRLTTDACAPIAKWTGEKMDYGLAVEVLLQQSKRAQQPRRPNDVPAGTSLTRATAGTADTGLS
jgi:hypothetical protein